MLRFFLGPFVTQTQEPHQSLNTADNHSDLNDDTAVPFAQEFQSRLAALKALDPNMPPPEFIRTLDNAQLRIKKNTLLETIRKDKSQKPNTDHSGKNITHLTHMLYAYQITREMEKRKMIALNEEQSELFEQYGSLLKQRYLIYS